MILCDCLIALLTVIADYKLLTTGHPYQTILLTIAATILIVWSDVLEDKRSQLK